MSNEILMNVWLAFNVVFGLWTAKNYTYFFIALLFNGKYRQNDLGKVLDMMVLVSILSYILTK